eukprot:TRINITY_DN1725_c0_g1_i1.p1 TRINITY_DN1725_c0_g1~~TRINITY_DN1725_c0_g1_i1.p1  ORF type:complete len:193 (+),score=26.62 TRINITY_DN1725_c0_g1_i1:261-839(+)
MTKRGGNILTTELSYISDAIKKEDITSLRWILARGQQFLSYQNKTGENLIIYLTKIKSFSNIFIKEKILEAFLISGINVNQCDANGVSALHVAAAYGELPILKLFVRYGALINALDHNRESPLRYAIRGRNIAAVKHLIAFGAKYNVQDLYLAQTIHSPEIAQLFTLLFSKAKEGSCRGAAMAAKKHCRHQM